VRSALLVVDASLLGNVWDAKGHLFVKHPATSGSSEFAFQAWFVKAFLFPQFLAAYAENRATGRFRPYMKEYLEDRRFEHLMPSNDLIFASAEDEIRESGIDAYVNRRRDVFYPRHPGPSSGVIGPMQKSMLGRIAKRFATWGTAAEIVISPLYDERALDSGDRLTLESMFGAEHVHDFSGVNEFTNDVRNYYEDSHYRPPVARRILDEVYGPPRR